MKSTFIAKFATYNIYHLHEHDECHETKRIVYRDGNMTYMLLKHVLKFKDVIEDSDFH